MRKARKIRTLDALENEIYRLKLEAKRIEGRFDANLDHLRNNYGSMFMNSVFRRKKEKDRESSSFFESFMKNDAWNTAVNTFAEQVATRAAGAVESLVERLFHRKDKT